MPSGRINCGSGKRSANGSSFVASSVRDILAADGPRPHAFILGSTLHSRELEKERPAAARAARFIRSLLVHPCSIFRPCVSLELFLRGLPDRFDDPCIGSQKYLAQVLWFVVAEIEHSIQLPRLGIERALAQTGAIEEG